MFINNELLLANEHKQNAFSEGLEILASIFNDSTYVFTIIAFDGSILYTNSILPTILGMNKDSCLNQTISNLVRKYVHPSDINLTIQVINDATKGQRINRFDNRFRTQNGSYICLSWMLIPFINDKKYYAIAHDITEQRGLKEKLEKSDLKIEKIFNSISDSVYALDKQWNFIYANESAAKLFSKVMDQNVVGKNYWDIFTEQPDDCYFPKFIEASLTQKNIHFEAVSILTNGWVSVSVYPTSEGITVYFKDITEHKKLEKSLKDERKRLYALLDGLPGLVYLRTSDGNIIFANHKFKDIHGEPENKKCYEILFNKDQPCSDCQTQLTQPPSESPKQWQIVIKDTIFEVYEHPFRDSDGTQLFLMQLLDITKRKVAEEEIARLDRLNLVGELAASIAHEVRNPMTTVRGFLQILKSKDTLHENEEFFDLMISELDRANSILTEFLSIAKQKTKTEMYSKVKMNNLVYSLYPLIHADATNQDKQVVIVAGEVAESSMIEREIRQLILNLTRNGLEAMHAGGILKIMTYMEANNIVLAIQDQGSGISDENIDKLGTPFLTTKEGGTGLGLTTCYNIAERHNAKIDVVSSSSGSTFIVRFKVN